MSLVQKFCDLKRKKSFRNPKSTTKSDAEEPERSNFLDGTETEEKITRFPKKSEEIFAFNVAVDEIIQEMDVDNNSRDNSTEGKQQRWISMRYSAEKAKTRAQ